MEYPLNLKDYVNYRKKLILYGLIFMSFIVMLFMATMFFMVAMIMSGGSGYSGNWQSGDPTAFANEIPGQYMQIFIKAQGLYHIPWNILAAICKTETDFGRNVKVSSAGAIGIMQFMPNTWESYKQDGDGDGKYDPYNPWDAVYTAANYLRACNFNSDPAHAIYQYNHAWWYVSEVTAKAELYSSTVMPSGSGAWPLPGQFRVITSPFGYRYHPIKKIWINHDGIDIDAPMATPVYVAQPGRVLSAGWSGGYGNLVVVIHADGSSTYYGHLSSILVSEGQMIDRSNPLGLVGSTGDSTGPHLHFEVRVGGKPINPMPWLTSASNTGM